MINIIVVTILTVDLTNFYINLAKANNIAKIIVKKNVSIILIKDDKITVVFGQTLVTVIVVYILVFYFPINYRISEAQTIFLNVIMRVLVITVYGTAKEVVNYVAYINKDLEKNIALTLDEIRDGIKDFASLKVVFFVFKKDIIFLDSNSFHYGMY